MGLSNAFDIASTSLATNAGLQAIVARNVSNAQNTGGYVAAKVGNVVTSANGAAIIQSVKNLTNSTLFDATLSSTSASASAQALSAGVTQLQATVSDATTTTDSTTAAQSPSTLIQALSSVLQTYSSSPSSASAGAAVLTAANNLANGLNTASATTQSVRETADQSMVNSVATINSLLSQFQTANTAIVSGTASGADITDSLDTRNTILQSLSQQIGITATTSSNGSMSLYTDSGVTLFETTPRTVTMQATTAYTASTTGAAVYVDGVPVTGANAVMPIQSGALAGYANLRDNVAPEYQSQLDATAGGLVNAFAETNTASTKLPGLFTYAGASATPSATPVSALIPGLAGSIKVNPAITASTLNLMRDGGINGAAYVQNTSGAASYNSVILGDISALTTTQTFPSGTGLSTSQSVTDYSSASASWLDSQYQSTSNNATYQSTLLSQSTQALSNATGVNIDSQMSTMLEYENSYQASAKLISTINSMFGSLLSAVAS